MEFSRIIAIACLALPVISHAHMLSPTHSCSKPFKPYQLNSEFEIKSYKTKVRRYKSCLKDFIANQNDQALKHANAADKAADEWNNYAKDELIIKKQDS
jgi:hypothetical protein